MPHNSFFALFLGILAIVCGENVWGSEEEELRQRAKAMRAEAAKLAEQGRMQEATRLNNEIAKMLETGERSADLDKAPHYLKERLRDLVALERRQRESEASKKELAEVREEIAATEREIHAENARRAARDHRPEIEAQAHKIDAATRRIHHLRVAAENLKLAEAHDLAHQIMEKAEVMERELQEAKERFAADAKRQRSEEPPPEFVHELRAEIERLRAEIRELRANIEKR